MEVLRRGFLYRELFFLSLEEEDGRESVSVLSFFDLTKKEITLRDDGARAGVQQLLFGIIRKKLINQ